MFLKKERRIVGLVLAGCLAFTTEFEVLAANPQSEAQAIVTNYETEMSLLADTWAQLPAMASMAVDTQAWHAKALANTDSQMNVFAEMSEGSAAIGVMYSNTVLTVVETGTEWTKVSSGSVLGYVRNEWTLTGTAAVERAKTTCANGTKEAKTVEEIAKELELPVEEVSQALDAVCAPVSLHDPVYADGNDPLTVMDQVRDTKNTELNWMEHITLGNAFSALNDREKQILSLRFYDGKTQMEVAQSLGISQAQVSRLEKNAIGVLLMSKFATSIEDSVASFLTFGSSVPLQTTILCESCRPKALPSSLYLTTALPDASVTLLSVSSDNIC